jgi:hypothetical protein
MPPLPLQKNCFALANYGSAPYSPHLNLLDYATCHVLQAQDKLQLTQKWALCSRSFGNCGPPKLGNVAAKLSHVGQAMLGEDRHR